MEATQLFLKINKPGLNNKWNEKITSLIKALADTNDIQVIEKNETSAAQINISYNIQKVPLTKILESVEKTGAAIVEINMHLPSDISGVTDPYGASAIGTALVDGELKKIEGITNLAVSSKGTIKVTLDPAFTDKQGAIDAIVNRISTINAG
jgi:hypothetical protein